MPKQNFPQPVLDPDSGDYPNCAIQFISSMSATRTEYIFDVSFDLGSDTLLSHIKNGDASYAVQLNARWTGYRKLFTSMEPSFAIRIPEGLLRQDVLLKPMVVAEKAFELDSPEFNSLFAGMKFPIRKGYILAWDYPVEFDATKSLDDLKNVSSILQIVKSPVATGPIQYDLTSDKIQIHLPQSDFTSYSLLKDFARYRPTLLCMFAIPAVAYALNALSDNSDDNPRWARVLTRRLEEMKTGGMTETDPWIISQLLLDVPVSKAMTALVASEQGEAE